ETNKSFKKRKRGKTKIISYQETTIEQWNNYSNKIENELETLNLNLRLKNLTEQYQSATTNQGNNNQMDHNTLPSISVELDKIRQECALCLTNSAYATLTVKKIYDKGSQPTKNKDHLPEFKKYRKSLRIIKAFDKADHSKKIEDIQELAKLICTFNNQRMTAWPIVNYSQQNNIEEINWNLWRKEIKEAICALKETCILKENKLKLEKINAAILQRCIDFKYNQKKMISSLTNNFKASVKIDRILVTDNLTRSINQTSASKYIS